MTDPYEQELALRRWAWRVFTAVVAVLLGLLLSASLLPGQSVQITGGDASLFNAAGGAVTLFDAGSTTTLGLGEFGGRILPSVTREFTTHGWDTYLGNRNLSLFTDGGSTFLPLVGVTAERNGLLLFGGAVGAAYLAPYASASRTQHIGLGYRFKRDIHGLKITSLAAIAGGQKTALESASYQRTWLYTSATVGWLQSSPLLNGLVNLRAKHLGGSVVRQTLVLPSQKLGTTSESVFASGWLLDVNASALQGRFSGYTGGAGLRLGFLDLRGSYYASHFGHIAAYVTSERLGRHVTVTETIFSGNGQRTFSVGGSFQSNRLSVAVSHQELFIPLTGRWQRVWALSLNLHVRDSSMTFATLTEPDGKTGYSAYGSQWFYGEGQRGGNGRTLGKFEISGIARTVEGKPVEGLCLKIGGTQIYTDARGRFSLAVKQKKHYPVALLIDDCLSGKWRVVSSPKDALPGEDVIIVVETSK